MIMTITWAAMIRANHGSGPPLANQATQHELEGEAHAHADREGEQFEFQVHGLPRQPCNRGVMTTERLGDCSAALALGQAVEGLGLLMVGQLELAAAPDGPVLDDLAGSLLAVEG
jgi:hypothetical protein